MASTTERPTATASAGPGPLDLRAITRFYLPLVLTSQMMTLAVPLINLALTRAADPQLHLAAYGVCFGLLVFLNAPMLISRDVGSGMATDRARWRRMIAITVAGGVAIGLLDVAIALTTLGDWFFGTLLEATPRVVTEARATALVMAPIPVMVGLRGLYSALALRSHRTRLLTQATFLRIVILAAVLAALGIWAEPTARNVAWALTLGILGETIWIRAVTRSLRTDLETARDGRAPAPGIVSFAIPLILSALAWTALRPVVNGLLGRTVDSEAAQASFAVLHPLVLLTGSALWALQATHQILATDDDRARRTLRFGLAMTVICCAMVFALGWIPIAREFLLTRVFTLPPRLLDYVEPTMRLLFVTPFMLGLRACFKGLILASGRTGIISASAVLDLSVVLALGTAAISLDPSINGALLGIALVTAAEVVETLLLGSMAFRRFDLRGLLRSPSATDTQKRAR